ncbi:MAG: [FeFe] hydrogenase H-cluster radical SAM maturase HydE [Candidatus Cloacimonetes bacterium HGW-Cloacimonetes-3]|jgi:biotin synthase|nr:MAG: [FeFe] hydrogenase H-cluster radical SAM maturase HydE [Candidatus Cloacimonetes bacterium HGW-Cloacimonetes-3]
MIKPDRAEVLRLLSVTDKAELTQLFQRAYEVKKQFVGTKVYFRGIVELSNVCKKNCYYCGIRSGNSDVERFTLSKDEAVTSALWAYDQQYGSVVIQSGERDDAQFVDFIEDIVSTIREKSNHELGITLSLGEQSEETYKRWYAAGAHRYLLRIETSNRELYRKLHPADHDWEYRVNCIRTLKRIGYQSGTGVMIGLPYQTLEHLVDDIMFFYDEDIDMIGMGPFIPHEDTPLANALPEYNEAEHLDLALKMIAVCRIVLKDVNIASTTALQALKSDGREMGLLAGANIIMPNITDTKYRGNYQLYRGKPCLDENANLCRGCLEKRISSIGEEIGYAQWGDSPHYHKPDS